MPGCAGSRLTGLAGGGDGQRSGCVGPFIVGGADMVVIAGQPPEHFPAAGGRVGPAATVLQDFAFESGVERFSQRIVHDPTAPIDWVTPSSRHSFAKSFEVY